MTCFFFFALQRAGALDRPLVSQQARINNSTTEDNIRNNKNIFSQNSSVDR
jgi:hypothetical protein